MRSIDVAGAAGRFLKAPPGEGTRIRQGASRLIGDIFESLDDERLGGIFKSAVSSRLRSMEVSPLLGHALASAINEDRHVPMLEAAIRWVARALEANEPMIREMVHNKASWVIKLAGLDAKLADAIIDGLRKLTAEMATDPAHPVRVKVEEALAKLVRRPAGQPRDPRQGRGDEGAIARQQVGQPVDRRRLGEGPGRDRRAPRATPTRPSPASSARCFARWARRWNPTRGSARRSTSSPAAPSPAWRRATAGRSSSWCRKPIRGWDAGTVTARLESAVGRDLQYIRINGTLVGGLVGLAIHSLDHV